MKSFSQREEKLVESEVIAYAQLNGMSGKWRRNNTALRSIQSLEEIGHFR